MLSGTQKRCCMLMFLLYLLTLTWVIVFKANRDLLLYGGDPAFRGISLEVCFNGKETILNVLAFAPISVFLYMLTKKHSVGWNILLCAVVSVVFESLQFLLMVGTSDVTDLLTNSLGGAIGIVGCLLLETLLGEKTKKVLFRIMLPAVLAVCALAFAI